MTFEIKSIQGTFANQILGLNLWQATDGVIVEALRDAWSDAGVLVWDRFWDSLLRNKS